MMNYSSDMNKTAVSPEQTGQESERQINKTLAGQGSQIATCGANPADSDNTAAALHTVTAGIRMGISPLQFMDSIDAGGRQLGNRAFLHWVGQVHADRQDGETLEIAAQGLQGPGQPLTHLDTLQRAFGRHDIRGMREHTGPDTALALEALGAEGYTRGGRMAIADTPDLYTQAHEAAHGVQQTALGDRMPLPNGIGVAGDRYERQADAVAQAVLRGESAQPLLDQMITGPTQVNAASFSATAPVQMRRRRNRRNNEPRQENVSGDGTPAPEAAAQEMINPVGNSDLSSPAGNSTEIQQAGVVLENVSGLDMPTLEAAAQEMINPVAIPDLSSPADDNMEIELLERVLEEQATGSDSDSESDSDFEDEAGVSEARRFPRVSSFFPVESFLYRHLTDRAEQIQTQDHGALSLPGIGNSLATVMLGLLMIGVGPPLDIFLNILGGMARCIMLLCDIFFGKPATWLLNRHFRSHPPSANDRARVTSNELPKGPPRGIDWNVSVPELIAISTISGYFTAAGTQGSLSPQLWLQPWNAARISAIIARVIFSNIVYMGQFTLSPEISRRILQNRLGWSDTLSGLFISTWITILDTLTSYITSYLTNLEVAVYLVFQNLLSDDDLTPAEATAAVIGYAAIGMLIQVISSTIFIHFVNKRVNEKNMIPWIRQFRAIPNRLIRTIAIALASFRNVIVNIMVLTLTLGQVAANIIGPLSTRFGEGGACFWPLAVADVCGEAPPNDTLDIRMDRIRAGEQNMTFGQLFAIQIFPWLVGLLALGAPVAYVITQYLRARRTGRRAHAPVPERRRRSVSQEHPRLVEEDVESGLSSHVEESVVSPHLYKEIQPVAGTMSKQRPRRHTPALSMINPGALNLPEELCRAARGLCLLFSTMSNLTPPVASKIIESAVDQSLISEDEADLITDWVIEYLFLVPPDHVPGEPASIVIEAQNDLVPSGNGDVGASPTPINQKVQPVFDLLSEIENFLSTEMGWILNNGIARDHITADDTDLTVESEREEVVQGTVSPAPEEIQAEATGSAHVPEQTMTGDYGASPTPINLEAQELFGLLLTKKLTSSEMHSILNEHVAIGKISAQEADMIAKLVREEVVLGK